MELELTRVELESNKRSVQPVEVIILSPLLNKTCSYCHEIKNLNYFYKRGKGYYAECKKCNNSRGKKYKENHKEEVNAYARAKSNKTDRDNWKNKQPIMYLLQTAKANAKKYKREFSLNKQLIEELLIKQKGLCYYTSRPLTLDISKDTSLSIDRMDSSKGYIEGNIALCQYRVNVVKNNLNVEQFIQLAEDITKTWKRN